MQLTMIEWRAYNSLMHLQSNRLKSKYGRLVWVVTVVMVSVINVVFVCFFAVDFVELKWVVFSWPSCEITLATFLGSLPLGLGQAWIDEATKRMILETSNIFDWTLKFDAFIRLIAKIVKNYIPPLHFTSPI